jgi:S-adenosylmethionine hydrolase
MRGGGAARDTPWRAVWHVHIERLEGRWQADMIVLLTDFGLEGPYVGQMQAVLLREAPGVPVINLFADIPPFDVEGAAYLLPAYADGFPPGTVFLCVVDPGVGGARPGAVVKADERWYVGPDEGLFNIVGQRAQSLEWWTINWRPPRASVSFHGRDIFAPVAARVARGMNVPGDRVAPAARMCAEWPDELFRVTYIDRFGNAITGVRACAVGPDAVLGIKGRRLHRARTFSAVRPGSCFWYENANGLVEIAANRARADRALGITAGDPIRVVGS